MIQTSHCHPSPSSLKNEEMEPCKEIYNLQFRSHTTLHKNTSQIQSERKDEKQQWGEWVMFRSGCLLWMKCWEVKGMGWDCRLQMERVGYVSVPEDEEVLIANVNATGLQEFARWSLKRVVCPPWQLILWAMGLWWWKEMVAPDNKRMQVVYLGQILPL